MSTAPTAVTNLMAVATSNQSIRVSWDLPLFPNGPILYYDLFYRASDTPQQSPNIMSDSSYTERMGINATSYEITGLTPYTNYTIHVRAIGDDLGGDVVVEILQRTIHTIHNTGTVIPHSSVVINFCCNHLPLVQLCMVATTCLLLICVYYRIFKFGIIFPTPVSWGLQLYRMGGKLLYSCC